MNPFEEALDLFGDDGSGWTKHIGSKALEDGSGWTKHIGSKALEDGRFAYCATGALATVCCRPLSYTDMRKESVFAAACRLLMGRVDPPLIPDWNDDEHTTFEDVRLAFKHCAAVWDADVEQQRTDPTS